MSLNAARTGCHQAGGAWSKGDRFAISDYFAVLLRRLCVNGHWGVLGSRKRDMSCLRRRGAHHAAGEQSGLAAGCLQRFHGITLKIDGQLRDDVAGTHPKQ